MNKIILHLFLLSIAMAYSCNQPESTNTDPVEAKIDSLIQLMTVEEKVNMIHASSAFTGGGVERLGIPELITSDGPHGVRHEHGRDWAKDENVYDSSTYLPVGTSLAATWNKDLGYEFGKVLGSEANFRGKDVILGPGFNIIRSPLNGRNFEYLTEDPYLNSRMVIGYIKGVQEHDVAACAKHYIANTLEYEREYVDVRMDERTLREIYLPAYITAVQEGEVLAVMAAYNKLNGTYCAHSEYLLDEILKGELGFEGLVMSDWNAVKGTEAVYVGMDLEMGTDLSIGTEDYGRFHMGDTVVGLVEEGKLDETVLDDKVRRILRVMFRINKFGDRFKGEYNTAEHQKTARAIADEAITLLKNEGTLPLKKDGGRVAVVGANATWKHAGAGGSSQVKAYYEITPLEGIRSILGEGADITYSQGYPIEKGGVVTDEMIAEAVANVSSADVAIYIGGWIRGYSDEWNDNVYDAENVDKPDMYLPFGQDKLIQALLEANPNTVIVIMGGGPTDMRAWASDTKSIVQAWYPGMEGGNAIAAVLFGDVNPSGKLPMTFPAKLEDSPAHSISSYPDENLVIDHKEGIFVGYRHFDTQEIEPLYPFGHGLSYTSFEYSDLAVSKDGDNVSVSLQVSNTGSISGGEVIQIYVNDLESSLERPEQELKEFTKVFLEPGASAQIEFSLDPAAFQFFKEGEGWILEPGQFEIRVGSSSRDIRLKEQIEL